MIACLKKNQNKPIKSLCPQLPTLGGLVPESRFLICFKSSPNKENHSSANLPHDNSLVILTLTLIYSFCTHIGKKEELCGLNMSLEKARTNIRAFLSGK